MKPAFAILALLLCGLIGSRASAQVLEFNGGWQHITSDNGLDGLGLGVAAWFTPRVSLDFNYDTAYDTSKLGVFELTSVGAITVKNHLQDFMIGPRVFFAHRKIKKYYFEPFGEVRFGGGHLSTRLTQVGVQSISASDNAFEWLLGAGADYVLSPHWAARVNMDLLRTHFADTGQSRLQFGIGVAYTFGSRRY